MLLFAAYCTLIHELAADMAAHGVQVVNLSLRGAGGSAGEASWMGDAGEVHDVVAGPPMLDPRPQLTLTHAKVSCSLGVRRLNLKYTRPARAYVFAVAVK